MMQRSQTKINSELQEFEIIHNTNADMFQSVAFCLKDHIGIISYEKNGWSFIHNIFKGNIF